MELRTGPGEDLRLLRAHLAGGGWVDSALLLGGVEQDQSVVDGGVEHGGEQDVDLGDGVGGQWLPVAGPVAASGRLELSIVGGDPGGGELVELDCAEVGRHVVAEDLLVALDRGVLQAQRGDPVFGVLADGGGLGLEPRVGLLLRQGLCEHSLRLVEALEPAAGEPRVAELGPFGVYGDVDLELPTLAALGCVPRDGSGVPGPRTPERRSGHVTPTGRPCRHGVRAGRRGRAREAGREQHRDVRGRRPSAPRRCRGAPGCPCRPRCTAP